MAQREVVEGGIEVRDGLRRPGWIAVGLVLGLLIGIAVGQAWAQRTAGQAADGQVSMRLVLSEARADPAAVAIGGGARVVGELVNAGPVAVSVAVAPAPYRVILFSSRVEPAGSALLTGQVPFVCRGSVLAPAPALTVRVTSADGRTHDVLLPLEGDRVWEDLRLVCLARESALLE